MRRLLRGHQPLGHLRLGPRLIDGQLRGAAAGQPVGAAVADPADDELAAAPGGRHERARGHVAVDAGRPRGLLDRRPGGRDRVDRRRARIRAAIGDRPREQFARRCGRVSRGGVARARGRDPVAHDRRAAPRIDDLEMERIFVAPVDEALVADRGGTGQVELDVAVRRPLAHAAHRAVAVGVDRFGGRAARAATLAGHVGGISGIRRRRWEPRAALLAEHVALLKRGAARRTLQLRLRAHVQVLGRTWLARSTSAIRSPRAAAPRASVR